MGYVKSLDGLRGLAIILVILSHYFSKNSPINAVPNGLIGVTIFFVLSGYLISLILYNYKKQIYSKTVTGWDALKIFYLRRSLRIFPIYYLYVIFLFFYGYSLVREYFPYFLTYTVNFLFFDRKKLGGTVSHLWSLAVEEQYYLLWPILVLFCKRYFLLPLIITFITVGIICQIIFLPIHEYAGVLPVMAFDAFGLGALLAYFQVYKAESLHILSKMLNYVALISIGIVVFSYFTDISILLQRTVIAVLALWIIINITESSNTPVTIIQNAFNCKPIVFIGKVSYGMYLFHTLIPGFMDNFYEVVPFLQWVPSNIWVMFLMNSLVLLVISTISWYFFESKINKFKNRFQLINVKRLSSTIKL